MTDPGDEKVLSPLPACRKWEGRLGPGLERPHLAWLAIILVGGTKAGPRNQAESEALNYRETFWREEHPGLNVRTEVLAPLLYKFLDPHWAQGQAGLLLKIAHYREGWRRSRESAHQEAI